ncbi:hypothetical protein SAMN04487898_102180 [Pedobacter sp. ok626]|nr:hypothetical protein SAMN04487898_102180 [Pedobacter sp. ok626]
MSKSVCKSNVRSRDMHVGYKFYTALLCIVKSKKMIYAKKKIQNNANLATQTAKIIANVNELEQKNLVRIEGNDVFVYPEIWKDKATALNWIKCLHLYCMVKKRFKESDTLNFKHFVTKELIGTFKNKKASVGVF